MRQSRPLTSELVSWGGGGGRGGGEGRSGGRGVLPGGMGTGKRDRNKGNLGERGEEKNFDKKGERMGGKR